MFKHKKKPAVAHITLLGAAGDEIYSGRLDGLNIEDPLIIELSTLYFNDPDPCYIHRGAVLSRVFAEIEEALDEGAEVEISALASDIKRYFANYEAARVILTRE